MTLIFSPSLVSLTHTRTKKMSVLVVTDQKIQKILLEGPLGNIKSDDLWEKGWTTIGGCGIQPKYNNALGKPYSHIGDASGTKFTSSEVKTLFVWGVFLDSCHKICKHLCPPSDKNDTVDCAPLWFYQGENYYCVLRDDKPYYPPISSTIKQEEVVVSYVPHSSDYDEIW